MSNKPALVISGISLPRDVHALLRRAARQRQAINGGRASASAIIAELVLKHRDELFPQEKKA